MSQCCLDEFVGSPPPAPARTNPKGGSRYPPYSRGSHWAWFFVFAGLMFSLAVLSALAWWSDLFSTIVFVLLGAALVDVGVLVYLLALPKRARVG